MSIYDVIDARVKEGRLFRLPNPLGLRTARLMFLSEEIANLVYGPWVSQDWKTRCFALSAELQHFEGGYEIATALADPTDPFARKPAAFLRQLHPGYDEVWEIRSTTMEPSVRLFGRFAAIDCFVVSNWERRDVLNSPDSREWRDEKVLCKTLWTNLFQPYQPLTGASLHDYLSANAISL